MASVKTSKTIELTHDEVCIAIHNYLIKERLVKKDASFLTKVSLGRDVDTVIAVVEVTE